MTYWRNNVQARPRFPSIYETILTSHDFLHFTTKGFYETTMTEIIGNYPIMYAINRSVQKVQRNASGTKPLYNEDVVEFLIYATPGELLRFHKAKFGSHEPVGWAARDNVYLTYNAISTATQTVGTERLNFPMVGRKAKQPPLNAFRFYSIGGEPAGIVRVGKKQVPARLETRRLNVVAIDGGEFRPDHPINPADYDNVELRAGVLVRQPTPVIINARMVGDHYVCHAPPSPEPIRIAKPSQAKFRSVML